MPTQIELLKKYRLSVRGHLGQHLLIDPNLQRKIVDLLAAGPGDKILEIGPGLGALTGEMLARGFKVWAVEKDKKFSEILEEEFERKGNGKNLKVIEQDFLEFDLKGFLSSRGTAWKVIGNLPYYISAPLLFELIRSRSRISRAVLTLQKEVADRLLAQPGTKDYGRLSLSVRVWADIRHGFDIAPRCFTPPPEVMSSVLVLDFHHASLFSKDSDEDLFFYLIQTAFSQRRKAFLGLLLRAGAFKITKDGLLEIFHDLGFQKTVRGEELLLKDFLGLAERLRGFAQVKNRVRKARID